MAEADVTVYVTEYCPFCHRAKALLKQKAVRFAEIDVEERPDLRSWLVSASGQRTVPQIFINNRPIGGFSDMSALDQQGEPDRFLAEARPAGLPSLPR